MAYLVDDARCSGRPLPLPDVPARKDIAGVGLSDADAYARPARGQVHLREHVLSHGAAARHRRRRRSSASAATTSSIASDVFEHVAPPVSRAFANARRLLKPGGKFIFTVPFTLEPTHGRALPGPPRLDAGRARRRVDAHQPHAGRPRSRRSPTSCSTAARDRRSRCASSRARRWSASSRDAGFARVRIAAEPYLPFGIHWPEPWSVPMVAYA